MYHGNRSKYLLKNKLVTKRISRIKPNHSYKLRLYFHQKECLSKVDELRWVVVLILFMADSFCNWYILSIKDMSNTCTVVIRISGSTTWLRITDIVQTIKFKTTPQNSYIRNNKKKPEMGRPLSQICREKGSHIICLQLLKPVC